ncbi:hypothetical protein [Bacillus alkalicellulosilyticus]|uniref:hypothetical protein n=1 Tax=Alkalihalobacterium alkalicellulosilyticum TaxID=1912214 RepID=UPI0009966FC4|nr:hypothetical protein [Bacillus alkalicellulosilyticus]
MGCYLKNRKTILYLSILIIAIVQLGFFNIINRQYLHIVDLEVFIPLLVGVSAHIILVLLAEQIKEQIVRIIFTLSVLILLVLPIIFYNQLPDFTYQEAINLVQENEKINVQEENRKVIYNEKYKPAFYVITGEQNGITKEFIFDPFGGEYSILD